MDQNCPEYLRIDPAAIEEQMRDLAEEHRQRYIVTDRFAVAVSSDLRRSAVRIAKEFGLRMQTHLNEQVREKEFVENVLYPGAQSYTDVYRRDGLLDQQPILAHCIHMTPSEWDLVQQTGSVVAHCPTSNTLLCSGIMPLDELKARNIDYAICTDVGASPTTSILAEMAQFLKIHAGRSKHATLQEALYRATLAPAKILKLDHQLGSFEIGKPMSFIEVSTSAQHFTDADDAIARGLLEHAFDSTLTEALEHLGNCNIDVGPQLDLLERDVRETAKRMEQKRISVTLRGEKIV
jgi:guanine deaminase